MRRGEIILYYPGGFTVNTQSLKEEAEGSETEIEIYNNDDFEDEAEAKSQAE